MAWNRTAYRIDPLVLRGATRAQSAVEVLTECPVTVVCLTEAQAIRDALSPCWGRMFSGGRRTVLNTSTVGPKFSVELERFFAEREISYVDLPVSGGPEGARAGTLALFVGALPENDERLRRILDALSPKQIAIGDNRVAQALKVVNNLCEAVNLWGAAEALALVRRLSIDLSIARQALTTARGDSVYLRVLLDRLTNPRGEVSVPLEVRIKDLKLALDLALHPEVDLPLTQRTAELFAEVAKTSGISADQTECYRYRAFYRDNQPGEIECRSFQESLD